MCFSQDTAKSLGCHCFFGASSVENARFNGELEECTSTLLEKVHIIMVIIVFMFVMRK